MTITLSTADGDRPVSVPFVGADHAVAEGTCPKCKATPFKIGGTGRRIEGHDTHAADGVCLACLAAVGTIRARVSTLFGIEEDRAVLCGRWRVY